MLKSASKLPRWILVGLAFPLIVLNGWLGLLVFHYFQSIIGILVIATILSFLLDYPVGFLRQRGMERNRAVLLVVLFTLLILGAFGLTLAPLLIDQLNGLIVRLPSWIASGTQQLQTFRDWAAERNLPINLLELASQTIARVSSQLQSLTGQSIRLVLDTLGSVVNVILTIVLTFYLLLHGERLWDGIFQWFPSRVGLEIRQSLRQNFHNYFIGQATLATLMGISLTVAFSILKVPFGLLFGLGVGLMTLIPFGGATGISIVSLLMAFQNFWLGIKVLLVASLIDQAIGNIIAPRILGEIIGLNPVWVLVSLLLGAKVGGLLGLLIAVPIAGCIKSIAQSLYGAFNQEDQPETETLSNSTNVEPGNRSLEISAPK
ncbi:MAG TPA: AI-2E family transporter [Cyanobacteria bacterium UBA11369]|nr:AI-2E family transporter [Cyanobacteria bacterium UBA11371]HBE49538.1 AI-2E family transporter [Cyanobacteria bacterium UBA11369]